MFVGMVMRYPALLRFALGRRKTLLLGDTQTMQQFCPEPRIRHSGNVAIAASSISWFVPVPSDYKTWHQGS